MRLDMREGVQVCAPKGLEFGHLGRPPSLRFGAPSLASGIAESPGRDVGLAESGLFKPTRAERPSYVHCGPKSLGFYEAEFVKARCKRIFFLFLASIWLGRGNNKPPWLWCSIFAVRGTSIARIERQSQLLFSARKNIGSSEQRNKWKGPVWQLHCSCQTGRRPFMPDATLNQCSCARPVVSLSAEAVLDWDLSSSFVASLQCNLWP